jgi:hypothetical protein
MVVLRRQHQKAAIRTCVLQRDRHQPFDQLGQDDFAGHGLRSFDDAGYIEVLDRRANGRRGKMPFRSGQMWINQKATLPNE